MILGGLYQLNDAFKKWANNYFGEYLACLLETGDLPTIGGSPGDSGVCEQLFKPFSLADGRPPVKGQGSSEEKEAGGSGAGASERGGGGGGAPVRYSGGGGGFGRGYRSANTPTGRKRPGGVTVTGNTDANGGGGGYTYYQRPVSQQSRTKLNNKFAFENQRDADQRRKVAGGTKKDSEGGSRAAIKLKQKNIKKALSEQADTGFSIGHFIRYIIIACIILALLFFIGGQLLQISKSMD